MPVQLAPFPDIQELSDAERVPMGDRNPWRALLAAELQSIAATPVAAIPVAFKAAPPFLVAKAPPPVLGAPMRPPGAPV